MGRLSSRRGTLADIALSHFSNVRHPSRQRYPSLSLEHTRRLWWSSTLEYSTSFSHGNCPFNWHSRSCCVIGFTGCILLGDVASPYIIKRTRAVLSRTSSSNVFRKWHPSEGKDEKGNGGNESLATALTTPPPKWSPVMDPVNCPQDGLEIDKMICVPPSAKRRCSHSH